MPVKCKVFLFTNFGVAILLLFLLFLLLLFLTFSALVANPKKLLYTVANPARGLLNREKNKNKKSLAAPPPRPPPRALLVRRKKIK